MRDFDDFESENMVQRGDNVFTRTVVAYIDGVDETNGTVTLSFEDFVGVRNDVELSFDYISAVGPGWFRFMPSIGDRVLCGFRPTNEVVILKYQPVSYSQIAQFASAANPPFIFRQLHSGEFEIVSSGYAEIWGSQAGKLHLAGGLTSIDLDRPTNQITYNATLHSMTADLSTWGLGNVRRSNPLKTTDDEATVSGIIQKECATLLVQDIAGVPLNLYQATFGNVLQYIPALPNGVFIPITHPNTAQNLVANINLYGPDGIQNLQVRADHFGNLRMDFPATATDGLRILSSLGSLFLNFVNANVSTTGEMNLSSTLSMGLTSSAQMDLTAPLFKITNNATTLGTLIQTLITDIGTLNTTLITLMTAYAALAPIPILSGAEVATPAVASGAALTILSSSLVALAAQFETLLE